jgi:hypothetical protein
MSTTTAAAPKPAQPQVCLTFEKQASLDGWYLVWFGGRFVEFFHDLKGAKDDSSQRRPDLKVAINFEAVEDFTLFSQAIAALETMKCQGRRYKVREALAEIRHRAYQIVLAPA